MTRRPKRSSTRRRFRLPQHVKEPTRERPRVVYLVTSQLSSVLLRGQLAYLTSRGFDVAVGTNLATSETGAFDEGISVNAISYVRHPAPCKDLKALVQTYRFLRSRRPDIVNASTPKAGLLGVIAARLARVPLRIYVVRGLRYETSTGWRRAGLRLVERLTMHMATHVLFNSRSLMVRGETDRVIRPGRGRVLASGSSNGVCAARFRQLPDCTVARKELGIPADAEVVGFVGRLARDKGIADLLAAAESLRRKHPRLQLLLVGDVEGNDPTTRRLRHEGTLDTYIRVIRWRDDVNLIYAAIDVLAFPSYREGLPNVPLEAQLCCTPVVGYRATGTVDAVDDGRTGILVPVGDIKQLEQSLDSLLSDAGERQRLGERGRQWVAETFDQSKVWASLDHFYRMTLSDTSPRS